MTTKTLKRSTAPVDGIAGLAQRRRQSLDDARQEWGRLVSAAAEGELTADQVERLEQVADLLEIDDIEQCFNDDVDGWRWVTMATNTVDATRQKGLPSQLQQLAEEIRQHDEQRRQMIKRQTILRIELESVGPTLREIQERKSRHPRLFF
jgi:hypothetical protein